MPHDAARRQFVRPRQDGRNGKADDDQYDEYGHRVLGDRQPVEGDVRYLQQHPGHDAIRHERSKDASLAKFLYQVADTSLHDRGTPLAGHVRYLPDHAPDAVAFQYF